MGCHRPDWSVYSRREPVPAGRRQRHGHLADIAVELVAFMGAVLGVSTLLYLPCALFTILSPGLSVLYGFTGIRIKKAPHREEMT